MLKQYENALERHILKIAEDEERESLEEGWSENDHFAVVYNPETNIVVGFIQFPGEFSNPTSPEGECKYLGRISESDYNLLDYSDRTKLECWPTFNPETNEFKLIELKVDCNGAGFSNDINGYISSTGEFDLTVSIVDENGVENIHQVEGDIQIKNMSFEDDENLLINDQATRKQKLYDNTFNVKLVGDNPNNSVVRVKAFITGESTNPNGRWLVKYISFAKDTVDYSSVSKDLY